MALSKDDLLAKLEATLLLASSVDRPLTFWKKDSHTFRVQVPNYTPEGPSTQISWYKVPKSMVGIVFGT